MNEKKGTILIVEDDVAIREMLGYVLAKGGYHFIEAVDVDEAHRLLCRQKPDLILLDWMLPRISGIDFAIELQQKKTESLPIIFLTAKDLEADKVRALNIGVDDYITKPFSNQELLARVAAVIRRYRKNVSHKIITVNGLRIDADMRQVSINDEIIHLNRMEFNLLFFFATHPNRAYSRAQILDQVWGEQVYVGERTVDVHIRRLRKNLATYHCQGYIQTVHGIGYRFSMS